MKDLVNTITVFMLLSLGLLAGCSNGSNTATSTSGAAISGSVSKGPINNASIDLYTFAANGAQGTFVVGGIVTDKYGEWTATLPAGATAPFMVVATGGNYIDEYTGATVQMGGASMRGVMDQYGTVPITPITDAALSSLQKMITDGYANNVKAALSKVKNSYIKSFGFDPLTTLPPAPEKLATASVQQKQYASVLGGISKLVNDAYTGLSVGGTPKRTDIIKQIAADFSADGIIDGYGAAGTTLSVKVGGASKLLNTIFKAGNDLYTATKTYQASANAPAALAGTQNTVNPINFNQTLYDNTPPQVIAPTSITRTIAAGLTSSLATDPYIAAFLGGATATDNIGVVGTITNDAPTNFSIGTTTVTFKALDTAGNIGTATASVTVNAAAKPTTGGGTTPADTMPPVVTAPANITVTAAQGITVVPASNTAIVGFLAAASAKDNVAVVGNIMNDAPTSFPIGATTVTFSASDAAGNTGTATATVTVNAATTTPAAAFSIIYPGALNNATCDASKLIDPMYSTKNFTSTILGWTQYSADPGAVVEVFVDNPAAGQYKVRIRCSNLNHSWQATGTAAALNMVFDKANSTFTFTKTLLGFQTAGALTPAGVTIPAAQLGITLNGTLAPVALLDPRVGMATGVKSWLPATSNLAAGTLPSSTTTTPIMGVTSATGYKSYVSGKATKFIKTPSTVRSTTDGVNWTTATFNILFELRGVMWDGAQYIASGVDFINGGKAVLATSNDSVTWSTPIVVDNTIWAGANNATITVLVGNGGYITSSTNGLTWTTRNAGKSRLKVTTKTLQHIAWTGTQFIATGTFGTIVTSPDGITWTAQKSGTNLDIQTIAVAGGKIIVSVSGTDPLRHASRTLLLSSDGITWTRLFPNAKGTMDVFSDGTTFFVNYNDPFVSHTVLSSTDGITWVKEVVGGATPALNLKAQFNLTAGTFAYGYDKFRAYSTLYLRQ